MITVLIANHDAHAFLMEMLFIGWKALWLLAQGFVLFFVLFMALHATGAVLFRFRYQRCRPTPERHARIAVMIPAYRANRQLLHAVDAAQSQTYPVDHFDAFVLAQHCAPGLVEEVRRRGAVVFEQTFDDSPGNPYLFALRAFVQAIEKYASDRPYDAVLLVDKDNLLQEDFLAVMNCRLQQGHAAVQGRRRPINLDTPAACFDYISEALNDQLLRAAKSALGLLPEVSGSGMAFDFKLYRTALARADIHSPVHDKTFFLELLRLGVVVCYEPNAVLFEEKTASYGGVRRQRQRWIGGQVYLWRKNFFRLLFRGLKQGAWHPVDYALTLSKPPHSLQLAALLGCAFAAHFMPGWALVPSKVWLGVLAIYLMCGVLLLVLDGAPARVYKALLLTPVLFFNILVATVRGLSRRLRGTFLHTEHRTETSLDEVKRRSSN